MARELVQIEPGTPELIALKFTKGTEYERRVMFTTTDNRILYLANEDARKLAQLGVEKEAKFFIAMIGKTGKQPRYDFRSLSAEEIAAAPKPDHKYEPVDTSNSPAPPIEWPKDEPMSTVPLPATMAPALTESARMMACFMSAIDAVAEAQVYATRKGMGITFSSANVTSTALSCYINECKAGRG